MESKCFSCKNKNVETSYGYTACNYSGFECRNFELYDPIKKTNADRIRSMTDEELASEYIRIYELLPRFTDSWTWLRDWLKRECE